MEAVSKISRKIAVCHANSEVRRVCKTDCVPTYICLSDYVQKAVRFVLVSPKAGIGYRNNQR